MVVLFPASSETNSQPFTLKVVGGAASSVAQDLQKHLQRHRIAAVMRVIGNMRSLVHNRFGELMLASFWMLVNIRVLLAMGIDAMRIHSCSSPDEAPSTLYINYHS